MKNEIAKALSLAESKEQYDAQCKRVLGNKVILAWILKRVAKEFSDMKIGEIMDCIEGEPEISTVPVDPGKTNRERVSGMSNEDTVPDEGTVTFDIHFYAYVPHEKIKIKLILNVEAQKDFYPGYPIVSRGILYVARMISAQLGREIVHSEYGNLKKVYSIWICMNAPKYIGNAIALYEFQKEDLLPGVPDNKDTYDKMSVVVITLNEDVESEDEFINMINTTLSSHMSYKEKKKRLEEEYHIEMSRKLGKEMNLMCNLSDLVEARGIEQGIERGIEQGSRNLLKVQIKKKIAKGKPVETIADELEESVEKIEELLKEIEAEE
ncbi:hypothetical protein [Ruminococcus sp. 5_1_39BFAA]|uniref:hypothetical protein n=1 Tax=Ruminococcus sp. 5_1_39BFAA TaxID=457412 RepID=UPI0035617E7A